MHVLNGFDILQRIERKFRALKLMANLVIERKVLIANLTQPSAQPGPVPEAHFDGRIER